MKIDYEPLEAALKDAIKERFTEKFDQDAWTIHAFDRYTDNEDLVRLVVREAAQSVCQRFDIDLTNADTSGLVSQVSIEMTPAEIVPVMFNAMRRGLKCPPGQTAEVELVKL